MFFRNKCKTRQNFQKTIISGVWKKTKDNKSGSIYLWETAELLNKQWESVVFLPGNVSSSPSPSLIVLPRWGWLYKPAASLLEGAGLIWMESEKSIFTGIVSKNGKFYEKQMSEFHVLENCPSKWEQRKRKESYKYSHMLKNVRKFIPSRLASRKC